MYYYRQRENSITSSFNKKRLDCLEAFDERVKYMKYIVKNESLYKKTLKEYYELIIVMYFKYEKFYSNDKRTLKTLKKKALKIFKENKNSFQWTIKQKIIFGSFVINPKIFRIIEKISEKKRRLKDEL